MNSRKLRVARIIDRLNIGGPAIHVLLLTSRMNNCEVETLLITGKTSAEEGNMTYLAEQWNVNYVQIDELQREISLTHDWRAFWKIYHLLRTFRPDVVHTHKSKAGVLGRIAAFALGVSVIIHTFHGHVFHSYFGARKARLFQTIEKLLALITTRIITISPQQFREISCQYQIASAKKFEVIPLGFDFSALDNLLPARGKLRQKYQVSEQQIVVGMVGRLTAVKNHRLLLQAATLLQDHPITFFIIGDGEKHHELQQIIEQHKLANRVFLTGWLTAPAEIYADLDIVVLTSDNEGTPVTLIEAQYCHKPVVATNVGGVRDIVADGITGFVVPANNREALAKRIVELAVSPSKREQMGQAGHLQMKQRYAYGNLVSRLMELYQRLWLR